MRAIPASEKWIKILNAGSAHKLFTVSYLEKTPTNPNNLFTQFLKKLQKALAVNPFLCNNN